MSDRRTASSITDAELSALYAERDWLRGERVEFSKELEANRAAVERARAVVDRLDGFAEATISVPDRSLYRAIAADLRNALNDSTPAAEEQQVGRCVCGGSGLIHLHADEHRLVGE